MKILTLNIWGVPYAKHRMARLRLITEKIMDIAPDIVCLQEVFLPRSPKFITEALEAYYPYAHHFASSVVGSGLLTLSKYPIVDAVFHKFRMSGKPFHKGDIFAGKGIGLTRIQTPSGLIEVYNCHSHAQYEPQNDNEDAVYTNTNLYEAVRFIHTHSGENPAILCGDLNTRRDQIGYQILTQLGCLTDSYFQLHNQHPITYSADNPYTHEFNQCLDYVMLRQASAVTIELCMTEKLSHNASAYSDHYGLLAEINFQTSDTARNQPAHIENTLSALQKEIQLALVESENVQLHHYERSILGFGTLIDGNLLANFVMRYFRLPGRLLRLIVNVGGLTYGIYSLLQALANLQPRISTLQAIHDEIDHQIKRKRLFDGREW